jgi:hypothetical protein
MARKSNDLFSLLASRTKGRVNGRSASGFFGQLGGLARGVFRGGGSPDVTRRKGIHLSGLGLLGVVFACVGVGYLVGDRFPLQGARGLSAVPEPGQRPGTLPDEFALTPADEIKPLSNRCLVVGFGNDNERDMVSGLAHYLRAKGISSARAYRVFNKANGVSGWLTVVYYDNPEDADPTVARLRQLPVPPQYPVFEQLRQRQDWPHHLDVQ